MAIQDSLKEIISFMTFDTKQTFNAITRECEVKRLLTIDVDSLMNAMSKFKASELVCLIAICALMDSDASKFPSRRDIVKVTGLSLPTVQRNVKYLIDEGYLTRDFLETAGLHDTDTLTVDEQADEDGAMTHTKFRIAKDYVHYFAYCYKQQYNVEYLINYQRDTAQMKRLMKTYSSDELIAIIEYAIKNYDVKWRRFDYPTPTIGQLSSWLANTVATTLAQENKKTTEITSISVEDMDYSDF